MADRRVPEFSLNNCAQSPKKTFMYPKFHTISVSKYTKCHISTNLSSSLKLCLLYCQKYSPLYRQIAASLKKNRLSGNTVHKYISRFWFFLKIKMLHAHLQNRKYCQCRDMKTVDSTLGSSGCFLWLKSMVQDF